MHVGLVTTVLSSTTNWPVRRLFRKYHSGISSRSAPPTYLSTDSNGESNPTRISGKADNTNFVSGAHVPSHK
jgi:hypothetical protein